MILIKGQATQLSSLNSAVNSQDAEIKGQAAQLSSQDSEIKGQAAQLSSQDSEIKGQAAQLSSQDAQFKGQAAQLSSLNSVVSSQDTKITTLESRQLLEISDLQRLDLVNQQLFSQLNQQSLRNAAALTSQSKLIDMVLNRLDSLLSPSPRG